MTSVSGYNIHKCPSCNCDLSAPSYSSYSVKISGPLLSWVKCPLCNKTFELSKGTQVGYSPPPPPIPLDHGGFDLVGKTFEEKMLDLKRQTAAHNAANGVNLERPPDAIFIDR